MATTKNEMTQIKAMEIIVGLINEGKVEVAEDVKAKANEVLVALQKKKDNKKKKVAEIDVTNVTLIKDYLVNLGKGATIGEIINGAGLVDTEGMPLSTSKTTSLVKNVEGIQNKKEGKKSLYFVEQSSKGARSKPCTPTKVGKVV